MNKPEHLNDVNNWCTVAVLGMLGGQHQERNNGTCSISQYDMKRTLELSSVIVSYLKFIQRVCTSYFNILIYNYWCPCSALAEKCSVLPGDAAPQGLTSHGATFLQLRRMVVEESVLEIHGPLSLCHSMLMCVKQDIKILNFAKELDNQISYKRWFDY